MNIILTVVLVLLAFTAGKLDVGEDCKHSGKFYAAAHYTCAPVEKSK